MTRLLHTGDLQIGCGATFRADPLGEQQEIVEKINALAVERGCAAIVNGGDTFEGRGGVTPAQMDAFIRPVEQSQIPWITITGNGVHDMAMRETNALVPLRHVPGLRIHSTPGFERVEDTYLACMPWVSVKRPVAETNGDVERHEINAMAATYLLSIARGLRAEIPPKAPSVLALHFDIEGAGLPNGLPTDATHGVILPRADLEAIGFDVILAAHIHRPQSVIRDGVWVTPGREGGFVVAPTAIYAGSPMPHNWGEGDTPHGVWIVDVDSGAVTAEFVPLESRPVVTVDLDYTDEDAYRLTLDGFRKIAAVNEGAIMRVRYQVTEEQSRTIRQQEIRQALLDAGAHRVDVRCTVVRPDRARVAGITDTLDDLQALDLYFDARQTPAEQREELRELAAPYLEQVAA